MIGTILNNRYKLIAELGHGGMAWVYLAQDLREGRQVAVKVLYPQLGQDLDFLHRFNQEAKLVMALSQSSPEMHVVRVLDYGSDRDTHYLVMDYVPGRDLRRVLDEDGAFLWPEALDIARQVALALDHAWQHGIVHRDVKPENIMLLPDGTVRVLDFGVARARTSPSLTRSGFVGSPYYASPEQVMGHQVDTRADLYSLGIVLYEMLTGERPFQADTPWAVINQHVAAPPPLLEQVRPDLPRPVARLVQKAMAKRPEDRFQSPAEMAQALEAALAGQELPAELEAAEATALPALLDGLYQQAQQAVQAEAWAEAVDLFSQVLKLDPRYRDVSEQLAEAGRQARLSALYAAAQRAIAAGQWAEALALLDEIIQVAPGYRDVQELRSSVRQKQKPKRQPGWPLPFPAVFQPAAQANRPRRRLLWATIALLIAILGLESYFFQRAHQPPVIASVPATATLPSAVPATAALPTPSAPLSPTVNLPPSPTVLPPPHLTATPWPSATPFLPPTAVLLPQPGATSTPPPTSPSPSPTDQPATATPTDQPATATPTATFSPTPLPTAEPPLTGQIAFPRFDPVRQTYDVFVCYVDGTGCRRVVTEASQPDFLPDGSRLVVHSWRPGGKGLVLITLSGRPIWRITDQIEAARPSVDAQGQLYVFHSRHEKDKQPHLYRTYDAEVRPIEREGGSVPGHSPAWLPDSRILYSGCVENACGILVMRADGSFPHQVVAGGAETNPEASPDGRRVAFMSQRDGNWEVYVVNLDGSGLQRLTHNAANDGLPTWSPDGRYLAFVSDRSGRWAVWAIRPEGGPPRHLFDLGGPLDGQVRETAPHELHGWVEERISWAPLP